jgi:transposase
VIPAGVQVFVALKPVDLRFGFERLAGWVRERVGDDARSGALFVFIGRRRTTAKVAFVK